MEQLHHNGVIVPPRYMAKDLTVKIRGEAIKLTRELEEMAMAWAKKVGTPYVEDPVFIKNFHIDFSEKLGVKLLPVDVDYSAVLKIVEKEREWKAGLSKEERKALAAERKIKRELNKEHYGWALVDGERMEIGNYTVEPSGIFMGRGKHPQRGRWKEGPQHEDIELNLSPDAPTPDGNWKAVVWERDSMWIARWRDKLGGKIKYVWLSDSSYLKQRKDIEKFNKALELRKSLRKVKRHIHENLDHEDLRRRKTATVTFLIDHCKFRVGDEKDEDEADTVGASTLRSDHISFNGEGRVTFDFLGKDSVRQNICVEVSDQIIDNLKEFSALADPLLFEGVDSKRVSDFLDEVKTGLSAKVFRTYYSSTAVESKLNRAKVACEDPDYAKKYVATMANLEAAKMCNHKRTISKTWERSLQRKKDRLKARRVRNKESEAKLTQRKKDTERKYKEKIEKYERQRGEQKGRLEEYLRQLEERKSQGRSIKSLEKRITSKRKALRTQMKRIKKLRVTHTTRMQRLREQLKIRKQKNRFAIEKLKLQIRTQQATRDYNLGTSLKSYIDPRIYYNWGRLVDYDWKNYYSKTLQRKFSWVDQNEENPTNNISS